MSILIIRELQHSPITLLKVEHSIENIKGYDFEFFEKVLFHPSIELVEKVTYHTIDKFIEFYEKYGNKYYHKFIVVPDSSSPIIYIRPNHLMIYDNVVGINIFSKRQDKFIIHNPKLILNGFYVQVIEYIKTYVTTDVSIYFDGKLNLHLKGEEIDINTKSLREIMKLIFKKRNLKF